MLEEWLKRITGELAEYKAKHPEKKVAPFAVNQIVHSSNDRLQHDIDIVREVQGADPDHVAARTDEVVASAHRYGCLVFHDVTNVAHAKRALKAGVDGLILVCAGRRRPCRPSLAIRPGAGSAPVLRRHDPAVGLDLQRRLGAGGPGHGRRPRLSRHALHASKEGNATDANKQCIIDSTGEEIVYTKLFTACTATT